MNPFKQIKRHAFEPVAEWTIRLVASFSIILIFLIFLFVFRETASLFVSGEGKGSSVESTTDAGRETSDVGTSDASAPETYGEALPEDVAPESYGEPLPEDTISESVSSEQRVASADAGGSTTQDEGPQLYVPKNPLYPEIYNSETGHLPADIDDESSVVQRPPSGEEGTSADGRRTLWDNLTSDVWQPVGETHKFGILPLFIGTAKTTFIAILIGAPLGILAAIYTAFFAKRRTREIIKPAIELLAGFPSVVIGFFCLVTVATFMQDTFGVEYRLNALVGGIGLSLAVIPIVYAISEDALSAVPGSLREASLALGSTEWQTAYRVMLPAAAPGVIAAVILGVGRAFGETMIAIMATGNAALNSWDAFTPARTFAATIGSEMGEVVWGSEHYGVLFLIGTMLFVVSFSLNALTELYVKKRLIKKFQGR